MMRYLQMIYWSLRLLRFVPFKIYGCARIHSEGSADLKLDSRLVIGAQKHQAKLSRVPINFWFGKKSSVHFGHSISFGPGVNLIVKENAKLSIDHSTYFTSDSHIECVNTISIGSNCAISWNVTIIDDNHHKVKYRDALLPERKNVKIGNNVWIGCHCVILPGTIIADNCIVAAGSVVKGEFPEGSLIGGNPAKIIRSETSWQ